MHTLGDGFSSNAARSVQLGWVKSLVFVGHPGHFLLTSVHVRCRNIDCGSQKSVLKIMLFFLEQKTSIKNNNGLPC
jgi:hypothetical protein